MVSRHGWWQLVALLLALSSFTLSAVHAQASDTEQRDYSILVDGREAGSSRVTITIEPNGTAVVVASAQVKINQLVFRYSFTVDAVEQWKDGKLSGLKATSVDNGKRIEVAA